MTCVTTVSLLLCIWFRFARFFVFHSSNFELSLFLLRVILISYFVFRCCHLHKIYILLCNLYFIPIIMFLYFIHISVMSFVIMISMSWPLICFQFSFISISHLLYHFPYDPTHAWIILFKYVCLLPPCFLRKKIPLICGKLLFVCCIAAILSFCLTCVKQNLWLFVAVYVCQMSNSLFIFLCLPLSSSCKYSPIDVNTNKHISTYMTPMTSNDPYWPHVTPCDLTGTPL